MPARKTISFLTRHPPYGNHRAQLCLEMVLASAVFEQQVNYVFLDDGVYQLRKNQDADAIARKTLGRAMEALALYGVDNVFVDAGSLEARGMAPSDLVIPATSMSRIDIGRLLRDSDMVFNL